MSSALKQVLTRTNAFKEERHHSGGILIDLIVKNSHFSDNSISHNPSYNLTDAHMMS